jgi:hypothetical protein
VLVYRILISARHKDSPGAAAPGCTGSYHLHFFSSHVSHPSSFFMLHISHNSTPAKRVYGEVGSEAFFFFESESSAVRFLFFLLLDRH